MTRERAKQLVENAMGASDLVQGYVDLVLDKMEIDDLKPEDKSLLLGEVHKLRARGPMVAGAKAILENLLTQE